MIVPCGSTASIYHVRRLAHIFQYHTPTTVAPVLARFSFSNLHQPTSQLGRYGDPRPWRFKHAILRIRSSYITIPPFERVGLLLGLVISPLYKVIKKFGDLHVPPRQSCQSRHWRKAFRGLTTTHIEDSRPSFAQPLQE